MRTSQPKNGPLQRFFARGESLIALSGLFAAALVLCAVGGVGFWNLHTAQIAKRDLRDHALKSTAAYLASTAEQSIRAGELAQLRTIVAGAISTFDLRTIRIALPEPSSVVIAEAGAGDVSDYAPLPEIWPASDAAPKDFRVAHTPDGRTTVAAPVTVPSRGVAILEIEDRQAITLFSDWSSQIGLAAVAAAAIVAMVGFYRSVRRKFQALGAVSDALAAISSGETDPGVLTVSPKLGPGATEWNALIAQRADLLARASATRTESRPADRRTRDGDLMSICDAMWQGLVLLDSQLRVTFINGAGSVFLRAKRDECAGKDISSLVPDLKVLEALRTVASGSGRGRTVVEVERFTDPNHLPGARPDTVLRFSIRPVRKEDNAAAILVIEDVTQQRVAEESRHAFVASATHELRTPLTNIRLYVDTLLDDPDQDVTKRTQAMNVISQEVKRLERMISDMLSVAQIEAGTIKLNKGDVRLEPIFEELKHDFAAQAEQKSITLKFDLPPKWPQMDGDRDKIVMALHNLVGNAIKYTPAGGEVTVRAVADNNTLNVDVVDTGIGIKDDEQPLVFEKFYRAKDKRISNVTGTGLGLAIARDVVRLHGGDITLQSQLDKGSTFTMTLPAKAA